MERIVVEAKVVAAISEILEGSISEFPMNASLSNDLAFDSLDMVELIMRLEDEFDVAFDEDDTVLCSTKITISQMVDKVMSALEAKN